MRGVAIFLVVLYHVYGWIEPLGGFVFWMAESIAIQLFFFVGGYFACGAEAGWRSLWRRFAVRARHLLPPVLLVGTLVFVALMVIWPMAPDVGIGSLADELFGPAKRGYWFVPVYLLSLALTMTVAWSLSRAGASTDLRVLLIFLAMACVTLLHRYWPLIGYGPEGPRPVAALLSLKKLVEFMPFMLAGLAGRALGARFLRGMSSGVMLCLLGGCFAFGAVRSLSGGGEMLSCWTGTMLLIGLCARLERGVAARSAGWRMLALMGRRSFPVYLLHFIPVYLWALSGLPVVLEAGLHPAVCHLVCWGLAAAVIRGVLWFDRMLLRRSAVAHRLMCGG